jgi:molybdopterin-guanine dinucleotide biosynthesis protein A
MKPGDPTNLTGVVLCGGESRRMGRDKGLIQTEGIPWALIMSAKLAPWTLPVVYSINPRQQEAYGAIIPPGRLIVDALGLPGPLEGLLSVHEKLPERDLLLLACDMPDLDAATLGTLIDAYGEEAGGGAAFFVFQGETFVEPFAGIYTAKGLGPVYRLAKEGALTDFSMQSLLKRGPTKRIPVRDRGAFNNYNEKGPAH